MVPPVYPRLTRGGSLLLHVQHASIGVIACNVDGHTRELGFPSRGNTPPLFMYSRPARMFPWHPGTRAVLFRRNPNLRAPRVYPRSILRTRVEQRTLSVVYVFFWSYLHGKQRIGLGFPRSTLV